MQYALVVVDLPRFDQHGDSKMLSLRLDTVHSSANSIAGIEILTRNCFLLPLNENSSALFDIVRVASENLLKCKISIFQEKPTFISSPS